VNTSILYDPVLLLILMSVIAMTIRLFPLFLRRDQLVRFVADDGYMYFQIVRNLVAGKGATFDGMTKTNGFHPLYPLLLRPVFRMFRKDEDRAIRTAITMLGAFNVATVIFVYLIVNWVVGPWAAVLASAVWLFNPRVLYTAIQGLEAPIWVFFASASSAFWLWMKLNGHTGELPATALLGILMGLAFLSRTEAILLFPAICIDMMIALRAEPIVMLSSLFVFGTVTLAVFSPWLVWCWRNFGRLSQVSGEILSYKHHADVMEKVSLEGLAKFAAVGILNIAFAADKVLMFAMGDRLITVGFVAFVGGVLATGSVPISVVQSAGNIGFIGLFLMIHILFYGGWLWRFQDWYYLSTSFAGAVLAGIGARILQEISLMGMNGLLVVSTTLMVIFVLLSLRMAMKDYMLNSQLQPWLYRAAEWVRDNSEKDALIASINTGILAFYSGRTVLNLSGAVNNPAAEAIHQRRLLEYVHKVGVDLFVDFESAIDYFGKYWGDNPRTYMKPIETLGGSFRGAPMRVFKVLGRSVAGKVGK
jgi:hypothetical protein